MRERLRGYAGQKKPSCVGTQGRRRIPAWVRRSEKGELRGVRRADEAKVRPDRKVRGAISVIGASLQLKYAARSVLQVRPSS